MLKMFKDKAFYIYLIATLIFFGALFGFEYATDTYVVALNVKEYSSWSLSCGRPVISLFFYLFGLTGNSVYPPYYFSLILGLIALPIAIYRFYLVIKDHFNKPLAFLLAFFIIVNPFTVEYFLFLEKGFFILTILFVILSFEQFLKVLEVKYINIIYALIYGVIASFIYQSLVALLAVLSICAIALKVKKIKPFIGFTGIAVGLYIFSVLFDFILVKIIGSSRTGNIDFSNIISVLGAGGPVVAIIGILLVIGSIFLLAFLKKKYKDDGRKYYVYLLLFSYLFLGSLLVTIGPYIFVAKESAVPSYRTLYPLIVLVILLCFSFAYKDENKDNGNAKKWQIATIIGCLVTEFALFQTIFIGRFINNIEDEKEIRLIQQAIDDYESSSGNTITSLSFYKDGDSHFSHKGAICLGINLKAFMTDWSDIASVNVITGNNYEKVDNDQTIYDTNFKDYKSDSFDIEKQLVFLDNTLHIYVY